MIPSVNTIRVRIRAVSGRSLWLCATIICLWMAFGLKPMVVAQTTRDGSSIAVLQTRADAIDRHLVSTDAIADKLWSQVSAQGTAIAEMQGEERAAFAILTFLTAGNFMIQLRKKKEL